MVGSGEITSLGSRGEPRRAEDHIRLCFAMGPNFGTLAPIATAVAHGIVPTPRDVVSLSE
jgi:hypothetical protein